MISWTRITGSRAVRAVGLETAGGVGSGGTGARIHVRFRRGKTYVYDVGNRAYFERFVAAASKGRFYVFVIKQRFDWVHHRTCVEKMPIPEQGEFRRWRMAARDAAYHADKAEFLRQAAEAFDRMMVADQEQMITFDQMEDRALEVGSKLERFLMQRQLSGAAREKESSSACCPHCHQPRNVTASPKPRRVRGRTGDITFQRRKGYCPSCRKAFFPSGHGVETGR